MNASERPQLADLPARRKQRRRAGAGWAAWPFPASAAAHCVLLAASFLYAPAAPRLEPHVGVLQVRFSPPPAMLEDEEYVPPLRYDEVPAEEFVEVNEAEAERLIQEVVEVEMVEIVDKELARLEMPLPKPSLLRKEAGENRAESLAVEPQPENLAPEYPYIARRMGWQGEVRLRVRVNARGLVTDVRVARSSGHEVLDAAAKAAVVSWKFRVTPPIMRAELEVVVRFQLKEALKGTSSAA